MRSKIIAVLAIFFVFIFLIKQQSLAQGIIPNLPQPGITCGVANGVGDVQKCCNSPIVTPGAVNLGSPALDALYYVMKPITDKTSNAILQQQKTVVTKACIEGVPSTPGDINNSACICLLVAPTAPISAFEEVCGSIKSSSEQGLCKSCASAGGVWTAIGCFNGNFSDFITKNIMQTGVGIAGGISLLCIMFSAFQMQTSSGNAEKIKKAQELLTNCITGLMIIIFSILILKIIGVNILGIPGFSK
ncbi:MAG: hypothetical protein NTV98_05235 [Candidatus Roizmanbacteria bacterium]|nr:hypothetical protein [Candidatus Roizmanbacteria bacterium]